MTKFIRSLNFALQGIRLGLEERNMKIHVTAAIAVILLGVYLSLSLIEWTIVFLCMGLVISTELFNSAIESICDALTTEEPSFYKHMGRPKDMGAGAVLVAALVSLCIGIVIFVPHFLVLLK